MFIGAEMPLTAGFDDARARLANLVRGGLLGRASEGAYEEWRTALARDESWGTAPWDTAMGMSRLAQVRFRHTAARGDLVIWPLRWDVTGPQGTLVPVLDADIMLTPAGADVSVLAVLAACRPPLAGLDTSLDQAIVRRCAQLMIQAFTARIAAAIMHPGCPSGARQNGILPGAWPRPETP
jgi:hypothetical protein